MKAAFSQRSILPSALLSFLSLLGVGHVLAQDPQPLPVSKGVYRLPYANGTSVRFSNDHTNHPTTLNRVDMSGQGGGPFTVVSAGAGRIILIVENNDTTCPNHPKITPPIPNNHDLDGDGTTTPLENQQMQQAGLWRLQWLQHLLLRASLRKQRRQLPGCRNVPECAEQLHLDRTPQRRVDQVHAHAARQRRTGDGQQRQPGGGPRGGPVRQRRHVAAYRGRWLVANWFTPSGFLVIDGSQDDTDNDGSDDVNRQNRIPVFCQVGFASGGDVNTTGPCDDQCTTDTSQLAGTISAGNTFYRQVTDTMGNPNSNFVAEADSGVAIRAGNRITLSPGFHAEVNAFFSASIGPCDSPGGS